MDAAPKPPPSDTDGSGRDLYRSDGERCHAGTGRDRRRRKARRPTAWAVILSLPLLVIPAADAGATMATASDAAPVTLLLNVEINGHALQKIGEFVLRDGDLCARRSELLDLGLRVPQPAADRPDSLVRLAALPGLTWHLDMATQSLSLVVKDALLQPNILTIGTAMPDAAVESGSGAVLEYDVTGTAGGRTFVNGLFEARAFSPSGIISSSFLVNAGGSRRAQSILRLDTSYSFADVRTSRRYVLGDLVSGSLPWTRPVRLGGAQLNLDFALRPDIINFPLPSVSGSIALPSTVDVLVNGTQVLSREIGPGPFSIPELPVATGAGKISTRVTDALGRQVETTLNFYASAALLAPGLQSFSMQVGAVRRNWGVASSRYGSIAAIANYRRGLSSRLTAEVAAEANRDVMMAGGGVVFNLGGVMMLNAAAAASYGRTGGPGLGERRPGTRLSLGLQHQGVHQPLSLSASIAVADRHFGDVAALNGDPVARREIQVGAGLMLGRFGTAGLAYARVDRDRPRALVLGPTPFDIAAPGRDYRYPMQHAQIVTASFSAALGRAAFYATGFKDLNRGGNSTIQIGVTIPLGMHSSASASGGAGAGRYSGQIQASRSTDVIGDVGFQAATSLGNDSHQFGELRYKSRWAAFAVGADRTDKRVSFRLTARGAVSFVQNTLFLTNSIQDSFAVVDTNGLANVHVLAENRPVGVTDHAGRLLVPDLRAFEANHLAVDPADIPPENTLSDTARTVRPQDRSGVVVRFAVQPSRGGLLHLVDQAGADLPLGSTARLAGTGVTVPVGYDGRAYVESLAAHNLLAVTLPDGRRCDVDFAYHSLPHDIPVIGPLQCVLSTGGE